MFQCYRANCIIYLVELNRGVFQCIESFVEFIRKDRYRCYRQHGINISFWEYPTQVTESMSLEISQNLLGWTFTYVTESRALQILQNIFGEIYMVKSDYKLCRCYRKMTAYYHILWNKLGNKIHYSIYCTVYTAIGSRGRAFQRCYRTKNDWKS